jgi:predicted transcriptional regulator
MITDFDKIAAFGSYIAKNYAQEILKVLYRYKDVSSSEAASRLGLHINTVQEFFEAMYQAGIVTREEVYEKKRPYYRYTLATQTIKIQINLSELFADDNMSDVTHRMIRERANSAATFNRAKNNPYFSSVVILRGTGRERKQKKINLTSAQGIFLYNLPFPDGQFTTIADIMHTAQIDRELVAEIMDIVNLLIEYGIIEEAG